MSAEPDVAVVVAQVEAISERCARGVTMVQSTTASLGAELRVLEQRLNEYLREQRRDVSAVRAARGELDSLATRRDAAFEASRRVRLGGSCAHGADKGKRCSACLGQSGALRGPYVGEPDGQEVADYLLRTLDLMCRSGKRRKMSGSDGALSADRVSALGDEVDRTTSALNAVDNELRALASGPLVELRKKLEIMVKRTPGSEEAGAEAPPPQQRQQQHQEHQQRPLATHAHGKVTSQLAPTLVAADVAVGTPATLTAAAVVAAAPFRVFAVDVGLMTLYVPGYPTGLSEAGEAAAKRAITERYGDQANSAAVDVPRLTKFVAMRAASCLQQEPTSRPAAADPAGERDFSCEVEGLALQARPQPALSANDDLFNLPIRADGVVSLIARMRVQRAVADVAGTAQDLYVRLCGIRRMWGRRPTPLQRARSLPARVAVSSALAGLALGTPATAAAAIALEIDLSARNLCDDELRAACAALYCSDASAAQRVVSLDLSGNGVLELSSLRFPLARFPRLRRLCLAVPLAPERPEGDACACAVAKFASLQLGALLRALAADSPALAELDLSWRKVLALRCLCCNRRRRAGRVEAEAGRVLDLQRRRAYGPAEPAAGSTSHRGAEGEAGDEQCVGAHEASRDCARALGALLTSTSVLRSLTLSGCISAAAPPGRRRLGAACALVAQTAAVRIGAIELFGGLRQCASLRTVVLDHCQLSADLAADALPLLLANSGVTELDLTGLSVVPAQGAAEEAGAHRGELLTRSSALRVAHLARCGLVQEGKLAAALRPSGALGNIVALDLSNCGLRSNAAAELFQALERHTSLERLDVSGNRRLLAFESAFESKTTMQKLRWLLGANERLRELRMSRVGLKNWASLVETMDSAFREGGGGGKDEDEEAARESFSGLRAVELGAGRAGEVLHRVSIDALLTMLTRSAVNVGITHLRIWNARSALSDAEASLSGATVEGVAPPAFEDFVATRPESDRMHCYVWGEGGINSCLDIELDKPAL